MATVVGPKGQIVITKEIRDRLGVKPGWLTLQRVVDDHVEVYFVPPEHNDSLKGILAEYVGEGVSPTAWDEARREAWDKTSGERFRSARGAKTA